MILVPHFANSYGFNFEKMQTSSSPSYSSLWIMKVWIMKSISFQIFSVIVSLKDAKAKVFEILNDLNQEKKAMAEIDIEIPR